MKDTTQRTPRPVTPKPPRTLRGWRSLATAILTLAFLGAAPSPAHAQCGSDPGNDTIGTSTPFGSCGTQTAGIDCTDDIDIYSFQVPASGEYTFSVSAIYDTIVSVGTGSNWVNTGGSSISRSYSAGTTVYVKVEPGITGQVFQYDLTISGCSGGSCGNDQDDDTGGSPTVLRSGCGDLTGHAIDCAGDIDFFQWTAADAGTYTFAVSPTSTMRLTLFTSAGSWLGEGPTVTRTMSAGETVQIRLMSQSANDTPSYTLTISGCSSGGCGSDPGNDGLASATSLPGCGSTPAAIDCAGDLDYYSLTAPSSGSYTFETTGNTDTQLRLYGPSNGDIIVIASDDDSGAGNNAKITYSLTSGVTYYVAVNEYNNDGTGDYTLVVSGCSSGGCGNDQDGDTGGSPTVLRSGCGNLTGHAIDCAGDIDFFQWTAADAGTYTFAVSPTSTMRLTLFTSAGSWLGEGPTVTRTMSAGETVQIRLMAQSANDTPSYTMTISGCSGGGCGSDPGNDGLASATSLPGCGSTPAAIDCAGDLDYYSLTAPSSGSYTFETTGNTDTQLRLYGPSNGDIIVIASDDDSGAGNNAKITYSLTSGVTYYVAVNEYNNDGTGDYTLVVSGCSSGGCGNDPGNDDLASATPLSGCGRYEGSIDCVGDLDFYSFVAPNAGNFAIQTTTSTNTDTALVLYDAAGNVLASDDNSGNPPNAALAHDLVAGQTYKIRVNESGDDATGDYSLYIYGCSTGGCGNDPGNDVWTSPTPLSGCGTTQAAVDCSGDVDFYSITAPSSGSYTFETTGSIDTYLALYDASGSLLGADDDSGTDRNARLTYGLSAGQKYLVMVRGYDGFVTGGYSLVISGCSSGGCGNDPGDDDFASATVLSGCGTRQAALDCAGDEDYYRFLPATEGDYTVQLTASFNVGFAVFDASHNQLGQSSTTLALHLKPADGPFFIDVASGVDLTGSYAVSLSGCNSGSCGNDPGNEDLGSATDLGSSCGTTSAAIDCAGDIDFYRFTAPAATTYTFAIASPGAMRLQFFNAGGQYIGDTTSSTTATMSAGEVVYMVAAPQSANDTPSYDVTISGCSSGTCGNDPGNEDSDHATGIGSGIGSWPAAIDCPGDQDVYAFTASRSGSYTVTTTGGVKTLVQVFHGTTVDGRDDNTDGDATASVTVSLSAGVKYFVGVAATTGSATGDYTLQITAPSSGATYSYLVPASAKVQGLSGTDWRSDLSIVNTAGVAASVTIEAWMRDQPNPNPAAVTRIVGGGEALNATDLLSSLFGFGSGSAAALRITSDQELVISTRTYNFTSSGTYGQYIRGRDVAASFQAGETAYLQGFREDATARSNLGLVNLAKVTNKITVTFYAADGSKIGAPVTYQVPAQGFIQKTRVLREVTSQPVSLAWATLTAADGPFVGYLSRIDAASGDPTFRPTMAAWSSSADLILPGIAKVHGAAGTNWVSDMVLLNTTDTTQNVTVEMWVRNDANGSPQTRNLILAAHECRLVADVLPGLFGVTSGAAAFKISVGPGVIVDARTFNQVTSGSYGQYVPAMYRLQGIFSTLPGYFPMVTQNAAFRTNLGLVNGASGPVKVTITLFDDTGTVVGSPITVDLADRAVTQIDRIVNRFTGASFAGGYLKLEVPSSYADHPVHAFVTVVDQKTGDPVYQTPVTVQP